MSLGVAFGAHVHPFEELLALVRRAEALGYRSAWVDGDVSMLPSRPEAEILDGWTVTTALLARTTRIQIGSIRLVHHWETARLAQAVATLERIAPGRLRFLISIGGQPADRRFGLPSLPARDRIAWLDETCTALRALWSGESVTRKGRFVALDGARVRPIPRGGRMPIEIAARGPRLLQVVAAHADRWEVNLPPVQRLVSRAASALEAACRARGRDPERIPRSMWVFTRLGASPDEPSTQAAFRRANPWFRDVRDDELGQAIVAGSAERCRARLGQIRREHAIEEPVLDLTGLARDPTEAVLLALAPRENHVDAGT